VERDTEREMGRAPSFAQESTAQLRRALRESPDPARATQEKRYLKSPFQFIGAPVPKIRSIAKGFRHEHRDLPKETLWEVCWDLWQGDVHEERALAMLLLDEFRGLLDIDDMPALERMLRESVNWDQVDEIAAHLVGAVLRKDDRALESLKRWAKDDNFWMRRAALLSQLLLFREGVGDRALFYSLAGDMMEEKEFFIRKAIGWVLRDISRVEPEEVARFVAENRERMSGVTFREATRRLPQPLLEQLGQAGKRR
jgi:3-methyladenine DNA glycosylase AlkD